MEKMISFPSNLNNLSLVCQYDSILSHPGDDVVLSCRLDPALSAVSMEIKWSFRADLICHYKNGQMTVNRNYEGRVSLSVEDLHNGNVSLTLKQVSRSQVGRYFCEVTHEQRTLKKHVFVRVSSGEFKLVTPARIISSHPGLDVVLPVHLSPGASAASMDIYWLRGSKLIHQYKNGQEKTGSDYEDRVDLSIQELQRGNISLTLRNVQTSDSGNYTCRVFQNGCLKTAIIYLKVKVDEDATPETHTQKKEGSKYIFIPRETVVKPSELNFKYSLETKEKKSRIFSEERADLGFVGHLHPKKTEDVRSVLPLHIVSARCGESVVLPAYLSPETLSVMIRWLKGTKLIYQYKNGQEETSRDYVERVSLSIQEIQRGNISLTLRNVQQSDSGNYRFNAYFDGRRKAGTIHLQVRGYDCNSMEDGDHRGARPRLHRARRAELL